MKRIVVALVAGAAVFALAFGSAATLNVQGGSIQAGVDANLKCQPGVNVLGWGLETDDGTVRSVRLGPFDAACGGNNVHVRISDDGGALIGGRVSLVVPAGGTTQLSFPFASPYPLAVDIADIHVFIDGANGA
jgi:hypothetical protein